MSEKPPPGPPMSTLPTPGPPGKEVPSSQNLGIKQPIPRRPPDFKPQRHTRNNEQDPTVRPENRRPPIDETKERVSHEGQYRRYQGMVQSSQTGPQPSYNGHGPEEHFDEGYLNHYDDQRSQEQPYYQDDDRRYSQQFDRSNYSPIPTCPKAAKKKRSILKIAVVLTIIVILIVAVVGVYYFYMKVVMIENEEVIYQTNLIGTLTGISVTGELTNIGISDLNLADLTFMCDGQFLDEKLNEPASADVEEEITTLEKGQTVQFTVYVGGAKETTRSTKANLEIKYRGMVNDQVPIDVSEYYE
jgi:hypothetical protein